MRYVILLIAALSAAGCSGASQDGQDPTTITSPEVKRELLDRWNVVVDDRWNDLVAQHPMAAMLDFHWQSFEYFPHPTYKGGTDDGYRVFAKLLLAFLEGNFDYLAEHQLFDATLLYEFPNDRPDTWTFRELVDFFVDAPEFDPNYYADEPTRNAFEDIASRIEQAD
jgi:hypothetical protein